MNNQASILEVETDDDNVVTLQQVTTWIEGGAFDRKEEVNLCLLVEVMQSDEQGATPILFTRQQTKALIRQLYTMEVALWGSAKVKDNE